MATKSRIMYVYKILFEKSDESHPVSSTDIIGYLKEYGIFCEKKAIYTDINLLREFGCDIVSATNPKRSYFLACRAFELPEVRLLLDAVQSASFITAKKTEQLLSKIETLTSEHDAKNLKSQVYIDAGVKCKNEMIYYTIDTLHNAIISNSKVSFTYTTKSVDLVKKTLLKKKEFTVSPYALIWNSDHYYLVCNYDKYENTMNLRLDKMSNVKLLSNPCRPFSEVTEYKDRFNSVNYSKQQINMFSGKSETIKLLCDLSLLDLITDKFGDDIDMKAIDTSTIEITLKVAISDGFVQWIVQYGDRIKVVSPLSLKNMLAEKIEKIYNFQKKIAPTK